MLEAFYVDNHVAQYQGDSAEVLKQFRDNWFDELVTDPPYGLSNSQSLEDRLKEIVRVFSDVVFPQFNDGDIECRKYSQLVRILLASSNLSKGQMGSIGVESWVGVPECAVDFNYDVKVREVEITTGHKSASEGVTEEPLVSKEDTVLAECVGDFILDFGDTTDFPRSDIGGCNFGQFSDGIYRVPISALSTPCLPSSQAPCPSLLSGDDFVEDIRLADDALRQPCTSPFILTTWRAKHSFMLAFDLRGGTTELTSAHTTDEVDLPSVLLRPQLVRTFAGTSCLSSVFEPTRVSFVVDTADGAQSFYFHLWLPKTFTKSVAQLRRVSKGFMGKTWDGQVPPIEIWKQCLRVLKPGAFAFVMCIPRADCLSRMIASLEAVGFRVDFTPIYWAYASGFPKAQNIGKVVDKRLGAKREVTGKGVSQPAKSGHFVGMTSDNINRTEGRFSPDLTPIPVTPQAQALDGSYGGFQPKPAVEVIIVAMKPMNKKTFLDQALKNRKGITWLDDGRIPYQPTDTPDVGGRHRIEGRRIGAGDTEYGFQSLDKPEINLKGRFPASLLVSDDVLNDGRVTKSSGGQSGHTGAYGGGYKAEYYGDIKPGLGDSGQFSRYFDLGKWWEERVNQLPESVRKTFPFLIVPKASKGEKDEGLDVATVVKTGLPLRDGSGDYVENVGGDGSMSTRRTRVKNIHPTVKPVALMSYLITLGSREGDVVLDPFSGSGTTPVAGKALNRKVVAIDIKKKYCEITVERCRQIMMDVMVGEVSPEVESPDGIPQWMKG